MLEVTSIDDTGTTTDPSPLRLKTIIHLAEPSMTAFLKFRPAPSPFHLPAPRIPTRRTVALNRQLGQQYRTCPNLPQLALPVLLSMGHSSRDCLDLAVLASESATTEQDVALALTLTLNYL